MHNKLQCEIKRNSLSSNANCVFSWAVLLQRLKHRQPLVFAHFCCVSYQKFHRFHRHRAEFCTSVAVSSTSACCNVSSHSLCFCLCLLISIFGCNVMFNISTSGLLCCICCSCCCFYCTVEDTQMSLHTFTTLLDATQALRCRTFCVNFKFPLCVCRTQPIAMSNLGKLQSKVTLRKQCSRTV